MHLVYSWLEKFIKYPISVADSNPLQPGTLPPVQKAALGLVLGLSPGNSHSLWTDLLLTLLRCLKPQLLEEDWLPDLVQEKSPAKPALSSLSMEKVIELLVLLYRY